MFIVLLVVLVKWSFVIWGCAFGVLTRVAESCSQCVLTWLLPQSAGVPITFLLGFYVSLVVKRWWEQYCFLPWPDSLAFFLRGLVTGGDQDDNRQSGALSLVEIVEILSSHWLNLI